MCGETERDRNDEQVLEEIRRLFARYRRIARQADEREQTDEEPEEAQVLVRS